MRRAWLFSALCLLALWGPGPFVSAARACPMCKDSIETDNRQPRAYMYSILFMLGMPVTLVTGFGIAFWRLSRRQQRMPETGEATQGFGDRRLSPHDRHADLDGPHFPG